MTWTQTDPNKTHIAFACLGFFTIFFALGSLFIKQKLFIGEAPISAVYGLIIGPHCLDWFNPLSWGNFLYITLEISRILLCIELVAVGIELPPKYLFIKKLPLLSLLSFAMIIGWFIFAVFVYLLIPGYSFTWGLLISACVTATDPVLAQAIIGKSKFAIDRVPVHIKNLLTAESACNDGLAIPFVYLALNLIINSGNSKEIAKDFICVTILYECLFGCILGFLIGYTASWLVRLTKKLNLIDKESNIFFPLTIAFFCAGISPILGIDDLLTSFFAGSAFVWDDWLDRSDTEESFIDSIDVFLNICYFIYFGSIVPWEQFNNHILGLDAWRLVILSLVFIFLRRFPAVILNYKFNSEIHSLKEAIFVGHFGPIGVSGLFACIVAISSLQSASLDTPHTLNSTQASSNAEFSELINTIFPIVSYLVVISIIVHGTSAAFIVLTSGLKQSLMNRSKNEDQSLKPDTASLNEEEDVDFKNLQTKKLNSDSSDKLELNSF